MIQLSVDPGLKAVCPTLVLGCVQAKVKVEKSSPELFAALEDQGRALASSLVLEEIGSHPRLAASREAYKKLGKNPSRYRNSAEALRRRIAQGKGLYYINNVVDINNLISLKTATSAGSYDLAGLKGPVRFTAGKSDEHYKGIGKDLINVENLPILMDDLGNFGSPTSDSERAMITERAEEILMILFAFGSDEGLGEELREAEGLLRRYAYASDTEIRIIR